MVKWVRHHDQLIDILDRHIGHIAAELLSVNVLQPEYFGEACVRSKKKAKK